MKSTHRFLIAVVSLLLFTAVFITPTPSQAETSGQVDDVSQLQGVLSIIYGDPLPDSQDPVVIRISLLDFNTGSELANLNMGIGLAHTYMGQAVEVTVARLSLPSTTGELPTYLVQDIMPIPAPATAMSQDISSPQLAGSQAFINLLCKFPDIPGEPRTPAQYAELFTNAYGSVRNFWETISYNAINFDGTVVASQWRSLPNNQAFYVPSPTTQNPNLTAILQDCVNAFDATTNFAPFMGINLMLNGSLGCCAWGGSASVNTAEGFKFVRVTWNPPAGQNIQVFAHETGHALGLPHSSGPHINPPSGLNIYVSQWDVMSEGGDCTQTYLSWGCIPAGTIAYYLDRNQWIPANRKVNVPTGTQTTVTLRRTQLNTTTGLILATVPINDSTSRLYTVEVRDWSGYDVNVPNPAVVIHYVDLSITENTGPALVVDATLNDNVNDAGAQWQAGETFTDVANRISIRVVSKTGSDYTVEIKNKPSIFFTENELLAQLQANATGGIQYTLVDVIAGNAFIYATVAGE
ncbi:MAG: hypothetical protein MUE54_09710, partial [Anaerolineae bacterium]|nr:hypothetical protein [Anaerolineae bacterium]